MNYEETKTIAIAKQVGLPVQAKINQIIQAPPNHTGPYKVPIYPSPSVPPVGPDYLLPLPMGPIFKVVTIDLQLYRDEQGNGLWLGYDKEYSILVWKPEATNRDSRIAGA